MVKMRRLLVLGIAVISCTASSKVVGQNVRLDWSTLDMGFAESRNSGIEVLSVIGQPFSASASSGDTYFSSCFIPGYWLRGPTVGVPHGPVLPVAFALSQNYPNPFNPTTVVSSQLPVASNVKLVVYDVLGREIALLVNERRAPGIYYDTFDGTGLASGVYFYRIHAGDFTQTKRFVLLK